MTVTLLDDSVSERLRVTAFPDWTIAPDGFTGRSCPSCFSFFTEEDIALMCAASGTRTGIFSCIHCGKTSSPDTAEISVRADNLRYLDEKEVRSSVWYHATLGRNWHKTILSKEFAPLIHLGTKDAALARVKDIDGYLLGNGNWKLYAIKLNSEAIVSPYIVNDHNDHAPSTEQKNKFYIKQGYQLNGVTRYVNRYESEGSISLIANPRVCSIVAEESRK